MTYMNSTFGINYVNFPIFRPDSNVTVCCRNLEEEDYYFNEILTEKKCFFKYIILEIITKFQLKPFLSKCQNFGK
jgi:hypothetical protein